MYNEVTMSYEEQERQSPGMWRRYFARMTDHMIMGIGVVFLFRYLHVFDESPAFFVNFMSGILLIVLDIVYETILLSAIGTTIGKGVFGIRIETKEGLNLMASEALVRTIKVWTVGLAFNIPLITYITRYISGVKYKEKKVTSWDQNFNTYLVRKVNPVWSVFSMIILSMVYLIVSDYHFPEFSDGSPVFSQVATDLEDKVNSFMEEEKYYEAIEYFDKNMTAANSNADLYLNQGYCYMKTSQPEKAVECYKMGLEVAKDSDIIDTFYNNLSWAYYEVGNNDEAVYFSEKGLELGENLSVEYSNYGNALVAVGRDTEAIIAYEKAIELDSEGQNAIYGLGTIYYDLEEYNLAIDNFERYNRISPDLDSYIYLALSYLYGNDDVTKSRTYLDLAKELDVDGVSVSLALAKHYTYCEEYDLAIEECKKVIQVHPDDYDALCDLADNYIYIGDYDLATETIDLAFTLDKEQEYAYYIKAQAEYYLGEPERIGEIVEELLANSEQKDSAYYTAGLIYSNLYEYRNASVMFEESIQLNPDYLESYTENIANLYYAKRYFKCIEFAKDADQRFDNYLIPLYIAYAYSDMGQSEKAVTSFLEALELYPENIYVLYYMSQEYFYLQDYDKAEKYLNELLKINPDYTYAQDLLSEIEWRREPVGKQVTAFIEENYLYYQKSAQYVDLKKTILNQENAGVREVEQILSSVNAENDQFTFLLTDDYYQMYLQGVNQQTITHENINGLEYIRIDEFLPQTAGEFIDIIENIESTQEKTLIIDLRDNYGGDTQSGCDILDYLLGDCVVCNIIYRDGYSDAYYSDPAQILFDQIYIFTNENSASCSELVTLGLKTYLNNVTVIGETTYGKGVGQFLFEDKENEFVLFLVNHFWNVREVNIMDTGIEPDIVVEQDELEAYLQAIPK